PRERPRERLELSRPAPIMTRRFKVQIEQPGPAIRPLEPAAQRPMEIGELDCNPFACECLAGEPRDGVCFLDVREQPPQGEQGPPAVDATVPVEAAEEDRMQLAWRQRVVTREQHMVELVGIFTRDMAE